ncbi:MAG: CHAT domain-containing protein [Planctomycetota bacterium]|jgi:CHAT domain-containing protein
MHGPDGDLDSTLAALLARPPRERVLYFKTLGNVRGILAGLTELAEHLVIDDLHRALEATEVLVEVADALDDPSGRARTRRVRAQAFAYANRFPEALDDLSRSVELAETAGDPEAAARARLSMVHALARLGRFDEAIAAGDRALDGFRALGKDQWTAKAEVNLGVAHRMAGDTEAALGHFDRARPALAGEPVSLAQLDSNRAEALLELNRFSEAESAFRSALAAFEQGGATQAAAIVEGNLADLMSRQGRLEPALFHFERARRHFEAGDAAGDLARLEAEQADAFAGAGLLEQAAAGYASALPLLDRHGLAVESARARAGLGRALIVLGRFNEAGRVLAEADEGFDALKSAAGIARIRLLQGELAMARGEHEPARALLAEALADLSDRPADAATARHHLAALALAEGDHGQAESLIDEAAGTASDYNLAPLMADLLHTRASLRAAQRRPHDALEDLRASVREIERIRGTLQADRLRAAFVEGRTAVYEDLVGALLDMKEQGGAADAFRTVEQAKSRALLDLVAGAVHSASSVPREGNDRADSALLEQVLHLHADLNALYSLLPESGPAPAIRRWRQQVEACERSLQEAESRLAATRGVGGLFATPVDLAAAQRLLDPATALVEYYIAKDEVVAFVVRSSSLRVFRRLATREQLSEQVELVRFQIERALGYGQRDAASSPTLVEDARRDLGDLHDLLMAPLAESLAGATRLIVVGHGPLHVVPFPALHDGRRHLIERFEIAHAPSASLLEHLVAGHAEGGPRRGLICGVPDPAAPRIEQEVRAVAAALPGSKVLLGPDATCRGFLDEAAGAEVVHLACHGWFSPGNPLASGLKLADRWLTVRDLFGLGLQGSVVVLSGCETGQAAVGEGDELVGLVQGFFAAGASALLMTLWALHDETAEILVASLYDFWHNTGPGRKRSLAAALQKAQRKVMATYPHPAFWAPFILVGHP